ncbi:MAG: beta-eliminating lyase-related protein [Acidobacteriota bacterium]
MHSFASDNNSGVHPEVMRALLEADADHALAYGDDGWTRRAVEAVRGALEAPDAEVLFVYNGTGANVIALGTLLRSHEATICAAGAHLDVDECGAPERIVGGKLLPVEAPGAKLTPELVETRRVGLGDHHHVQPKLIAITQASELGQVYTPGELRTLTDYAHQNGLLVFMDGARLANAAASLGCSLAEVTTEAGVDAVSVGGTKNGLMFGEALVFLRPEQAGPARFQRKQTTQLASKMRYLGAQFEAYLKDDLWRRNAEQANAMARRLEAGARELGLELTEKVEANGLFVRLDPRVAERVRQSHFFYDWNPARQEVRWMCSFDTTETEVDDFLEALSVALKEASAG